MKLILILADGYVNKQNCRIWGTENPHAYIENPQVTVWCGFWSIGIIEPFCFENEQGKAVTVNGDHNPNEFLFTKIEEEDMGNIWFQQDGATCHTAEATLDALRPVFQDRIISRRLANSELRFDTYYWTIICGVLSKISVTPTSQTQLTF